MVVEKSDILVVFQLHGLRSKEKLWIQGYYGCSLLPYSEVFFKSLDLFISDEALLWLTLSKLINA